MSGASLNKKITFTRKKSNLVIGVVLSVLVIVGAIAERRLTHLQEELIRDNLRKIIRANAEALHLGLDSYEGSAKTAAALPEIRLLADSVNRKVQKLSIDQWDGLPEAIELDKRLASICKNSGFEDYFLINEAGEFTSASQPYFVGHRMPRPEIAAQLIAKGGVHLTLPKYYELAETVEQRQDLVMFIAVVLRNLEGKKSSVLALRINPDDGFTKVLRASKTKAKAETFAINQDGYMISASRFEDELRAKGLLAKDKRSSVLNIRVANGGRRALEKVNYPEISSDLEGYLSYRGEAVVGARTYLAEYGFEILTELQYDEAYRSLFIVRVIFWSLFSMSTLFALGLIYYSFSSVKMNKRMQEAILEAKELGQFHLSEKIGEGAMGVVYRAEHKMMRRETALKLLKKDVLQDLDLQLFEKEVQMTCRLTHPNTISIYDYGQTDEGIFYYAMEYLDGLSLRLLINDTGPLLASRAVYILRKICASLNEAHNIGLIHRDIKADNIVLCKQAGIYDVVKVLDFGLVRDLKGVPDALQDKISGTPRYISPEAIETPSDVDARTDIYALGILLCLMITGKYPYPDTDSQGDMLLLHLEAEPSKPSDLVRFVIPSLLDEIVLWCLKKDRTKRPQSVLELDAKLAEYEADWNEAKAAVWWEQHNELLDDSGVGHLETKQFDKTIQVI